MTLFILEQQELKLKKNSKSRKKRKQNTEEEEGKIFCPFTFSSVQNIALRTWDPLISHLHRFICLTELEVGGGGLRDVFLLSSEAV